MSDKPERVGGLIDTVLRSAGVADGVQRAQVVEEWPERVGSAIAEVTRVSGFSGGTLFVEVTSSAWAMELNFMRDDILAKLNADRDGAPIEKIVFLQSETE